MRYVKENKIYEIYEIRKLFPNMSIPNNADLSEFGFETLIETEIPIQEGFYAIEDTPVNNTQTWKLIPIEVQVPQTVTKLQAMKQLKVIGKWEDVKMVLASNEDINDEWLLSNELNRSYPLVTQMGIALNLNDEQLDNLFIEASKLS